VIFSGTGTSWGRCINLSTSRAATTNSMVNKPNKIIPMGVRRFRNFRLPVATLYKKSIHLFFKLTILTLFYIDYSIPKIDDFVKSQKTPSPLKGEGWGEGE
jgi:hypothetical protein